MTMFVLSVTPDTWRPDKWRIVGVFDSEREANEQGIRYKARTYAGYRVTEVPVNPSYNEWNTQEEDEL